MIAADRLLARNVWTQPAAPQASALLSFTAATLGKDANTVTARDVTKPMAELRVVKDAGEIELLKKASEASIEAQRVMMKAVKAGSDGAGAGGAR